MRPASWTAVWRRISNLDAGVGISAGSATLPAVQIPKRAMRNRCNGYIERDCAIPHEFLRFTMQIERLLTRRKAESAFSRSLYQILHWRFEE